MKNHNRVLSTSGPPEDLPEEAPEEAMVQQLRERIAELEAENANLRQLDETVRRNVRLFQALLRNSQDGFLLVTPQMTFLRMIHSVLGNSDQDVVGRPVLSIVHPDDHVQVSEAFSRLLSDPAKTVTCECRACDKNGDWCWLEVEMTDMLDDPDVQAIVLNNRNISQRKKYEAALEELESHRACGGCACDKNT
jgi:PAS domain S-box-containing protein